MELNVFRMKVITSAHNRYFTHVQGEYFYMCSSLMILYVFKINVLYIFKINDLKFGQDKGFFMFQINVFTCIQD